MRLHQIFKNANTINTMAGGQANVEQGLQTGLDIIATMAWWDWQTPEMLEAQEQDANAQTDGGRLNEHVPDSAVLADLAAGCVLPCQEQ